MALWQEKPYYQYFSAEASLHWGQPCAASDFVHFRKRLGKEGIQALFALSLHMHGNKLAKAQEVLMDTTVEEKNITYPIGVYEKPLRLMTRIVKQERKDSEKIYSLSSPEVSCIAKGKVGKKYEFSSKVALATLAVSQEVVGVERFTGNPHDSRPLAVALDSIGRMFGKEFSRVIVDRGYRGHGKVGESELILPGRCTGKSGYTRHRQEWLYTSTA